MIDIIRGDWRFFWPESLSSFVTAPSTWDSSLNTGIGISSTNTMWITSYLNLTSAISQFLHLNWFLTGLFFWIIPILMISFITPFLLFKYCFPGKRLGTLLASFLYVFNTYFLLIFGGGQLGICFAYGLLPLVLLRFFVLYKNQTLRNVILFSLVFSIQTLFDIRLTLLTFGACVFFFLINWSFSFKKFSLCFIVPILVTVLLHSFWILPLVFYPHKFLPESYTGISAVEFFSFAKFENTISLLHPNWPENLFGKVYFMRVGFLLVPILAFSSLLFITKKSKERMFVIFFSLLAFCSAFLAKGTNDPFSFVYYFLFKNIPGFSMFRDSTKFYSLIAVSFAMLIPFSVDAISQFLKAWLKHLKKRKKHLPLVTPFTFFVILLLWIFLLRGLVLENKTIFRIKRIPHEYTQLNTYITDQDEWFRSLWIPQWQRYGFTSVKNPAIGRTEIFHEASISSILKDLKSQTRNDQMDRFGVKYVIVPYDSESEIFLSDHKYSEQEYQQIVKGVNQIPWLKKEREFGKILIYKNKDYKDRFYLSPASESAQISFTYKKPTLYQVSVRNISSNSILVFSESYSSGWKAKNGENTIPSKNYKGLNSFELPKSHASQLVIYYKPQKLVNVGFVISGITFCIMFFYLFRDKIKR